MRCIFQNTVKRPRSFLHGWKKAGACFILALFCHTANAQQDWLTTQNHFNLYGINDAFAGESDALNATLRLREQWVGFEGSPSTQYISVHSPVTNRLSAGGQVYYDRVGARSRIAAKLSVGTFVDMAFAKLRFGIGARYLNQSYNQGKLQTRDPEMEALMLTSVGSGIGVSGGLMLVSDKWYVGIQGENLNSPMIGSGGQSFQQNPEVRALAGYVFPVSENVAIKPVVSWRQTIGGLGNGDFGLTALLMNKLWIGAGYRTSSAAYGLLQFRFSEIFQVGYSYDYTTSSLAAYESGSHEIFLSVVLGKKKASTTSIRYFK